MITINDVFENIDGICNKLDGEIIDFQNINRKNRENRETGKSMHSSFDTFSIKNEIEELISNISKCFNYYDCNDQNIQTKLADYINRAFKLIRKYGNEVLEYEYLNSYTGHKSYMNKTKDFFKNKTGELRRYAFQLSDIDAKKDLFGNNLYTLYNKYIEDDSKDDWLKLLRTLPKDDAFEILENLGYYSSEESYSDYFTKEAEPNAQNNDNAIILSILNDEEPVVSLEQYCKLHNAFFPDYDFKADRYSKNELIDVLRGFINQHQTAKDSKDDKNIDFYEKYIKLIAQTLEQLQGINLNTSGSIDDIVDLLKPIIIELNDRRSKNEVEQEIGNNSINEEQLKLAPKLLSFYDYIRLLVNSGVNIEDINQLPYENMNDLYLGTKQILAGLESDKEAGYCKKIVEEYLKDKNIDIKDTREAKEDKKQVSNEQFLSDFFNYYEKEQLLEIDNRISPLEKFTNDCKFEKMGFEEGQECDKIVEKIAQLFDNHDSEESCTLDQNKIATYLGRLANIYALGLAHSAGVYEESGFKSNDEYANHRMSRLCDLVSRMTSQEAKEAVLTDENGYPTAFSPAKYVKKAFVKVIQTMDTDDRYTAIINHGNKVSDARGQLTYLTREFKLLPFQKYIKLLSEVGEKWKFHPEVKEEMKGLDLEKSTKRASSCYKISEFYNGAVDIIDFGDDNQIELCFNSLKEYLNPTGYFPYTAEEINTIFKKAIKSAGIEVKENERLEDVIKRCSDDIKFQSAFIRAFIEDYEQYNGIIKRDDYFEGFLKEILTYNELTTSDIENLTNEIEGANKGESQPDNSTHDGQYGQ